MTEISEKEKFKLKKLVKYLDKIKGRHTELVTVYVPAGYNIYEMISTLKTEQGTAENIKSKTVRKNVVSALDKIIRQLSFYKKTPPNGVALFAGNISEQEGKSDIQVWIIEPPEQLKTKLYWCSQAFDLEPLRDIVAEKEVFAILCLDRSEADIALLVGKRLTPIVHMESIVPGKYRAGGQSAARFSRVREGLKLDWYKKVAGAMNKLAAEHPEIIGVLVSGTGPGKEEFTRAEYLHDVVTKKVLGLVDTSYTGEFGVQETIERGQDLIKQTEVMKEKNMLQKFLVELQKPHSLVVYGIEQTTDALQKGILEVLIISEALDLKEIEYDCNCEGRQKKTLPANTTACPVCKQPMRNKSERDAADILEEIATNFGTKFIVVSRDTREGEQFLAMSGIGGFLRYRG